MVERRETSDRRVNTPKQGLPFYCTRQITDRRQKKLTMPKKHWTEYDIELITRCLTDKLGTSSRVFAVRLRNRNVCVLRHPRHAP
jgi:hypothetical protein